MDLHTARNADAKISWTARAFLVVIPCSWTKMASLDKTGQNSIFDVVAKATIIKLIEMTKTQNEC